MSAYSFLAGVLTGAVLLAVVFWLGRAGASWRQGSLRQVGLMAGGAVAVFALGAAVLYLVLARPHAAPVAVSPAPHPVAAPASGEAAAQPGGQAQSMEAATAGLAARLARGGGSDQEWELLAKSYDFLNKPEDAKRARAHQVDPAALVGAGAGAGGAVPSMRDALQAVAEADSGTEPNEAAVRAQLEQDLRNHPDDVQTLLNLAALDQKAQQYTQAREQYQRVIAKKGMTADAWADYADDLAALSGGSLAGEASAAIERSLALEPHNEKALWLKASGALQAHRYADALALWKTLKGSLPAGSPDLAAVDANIAEASQLAGGAAPAGGAVSGTVSIDSHLASQVGGQATLFIYARAAGEQGGPPLAVMRLPAGSWPVSFRLDDSMAMMPSRRLSQFEKVVVEARISRSGQAAPESGDLYVTSEVVRPADGKPLTLVINRKIT